MTTSVALTTTTSSATLVKMANGEYTAASVAADPTDAAKLGLKREKDGNYGTAAVSPTTSSAASTTASSTLAAVTGLTLGGV